MDWLSNFVSESNRIEGIKETIQLQIDAHQDFLMQEILQIGDLVKLVGVLQPDAVLRDVAGRNVRVGGHIPPKGGPLVISALDRVLTNSRHGGCHEVHVDYENLHPFTDGNGRSGRAVWAWMMLRDGPRSEAMLKQLGFLHSFYYQTLSASDARSHREGMR